jgi:hypothetical protein
MDSSSYQSFIIDLNGSITTDNETYVFGLMASWSGGRWDYNQLY